MWARKEERGSRFRAGRRGRWARKDRERAAMGGLLVVEGVWAWMKPG